MHKYVLDHFSKKKIVEKKTEKRIIVWNGLYDLVGLVWNGLYDLVGLVWNGLYDLVGLVYKYQG